MKSKNKARKGDFLEDYMYIYDDFIMSLSLLQLKRCCKKLGYIYLEFLIKKKLICKEMIDDIRCEYSDIKVFMNCDYYTYFFKSSWFMSDNLFIVSNFLKAVNCFKG